MLDKKEINSYNQHTIVRVVSDIRTYIERAKPLGADTPKGFFAVNMQHKARSTKILERESAAETLRNRFDLIKVVIKKHKAQLKI